MKGLISGLWIWFEIDQIRIRQKNGSGSPNHQEKPGPDPDFPFKKSFITYLSKLLHEMKFLMIMKKKWKEGCDFRRIVDHENTPRPELYRNRIRIRPKNPNPRPLFKCFVAIVASRHGLCKIFGNLLRSTHLRDFNN